MSLRTPRRRISPRAKRRCRAIRNFFKRALGSSSHQDLKINSSIALNVTDLKHRIGGIEHQLHQVRRQCDDYACTESTTLKGTEHLSLSECQCVHEETPSTSRGSTRDHSDQQSHTSATKVLYKKIDSFRRKSDETDYVSVAKYNHDIEERKHKTLPTSISHEERHLHSTKSKRQRNKRDNRNSMIGYEPNVRQRSGSRVNTSYHTGAPPLTQHIGEPSPPRTHPRHKSPQRDPSLEYQHNHKHATHRECEDPRLDVEHAPRKHEERTKRYDSASPNRCQEEKLPGYRNDKHYKNRKKRHGRSKVDQGFIYDLIQKQYYEPVKAFDRRHSGISQISVPVCRDQEFSRNDNIQEGTLCSCFHQSEPRYPTATCRSVCDAHLYRPAHAQEDRRRQHRYVDIYNDSTLYDVVPVKEKPSPKSRRKFVEDDIIGYEYYKEAPPSPNMHRPRLNLKQRYIDYDEYMASKNRTHCPQRFKRQCEYYGEYQESSDIASEVEPHRYANSDEKCKIFRQAKGQTYAQSGYQNNLDSHRLDDDQEEVVIGNNNNNFNKTQDSVGSDKTDKALCEIKDILQCFLQEIKKDTLPEKVEATNQGAKAMEAANRGEGPSSPSHAATASNNVDIMNMLSGAQTLPIAPNYTVAQCTVPTTFQPWCSSMVPMCCMQNGYPSPSPSCVCHCCFNKETLCTECAQKKESVQRTKNSETEELIKEIYKFVTLNPDKGREKDADKHAKEKKLTSRSVGDSARVTRHDANVATSVLKCYSKSCEAIGSRLFTESSYTTHSDTLLERLKLDDSQSESTTTIMPSKSKKNKFKRVLKSLLGIKKSEPTETTESSSVPTDIRPDYRYPPFRQDIQNYAMYGQEYYQQPSVPYVPGYDQYTGFGSPPPQGFDHGPYYPPPAACHGHPPLQGVPHYHHLHHQRELSQPPPPPPPPPPANPYRDPYDPAFHYPQPQVPLCLKEVEIKSTGTQSERKMSFFRKLGRKTPPGGDPAKNTSPPPQPHYTAGTQTPAGQPLKTQPQASKPLFPGWKKFQEKVKTDLEQDPLYYGMKTKQKLQAGDKKLKTAMVKKMFYKRNPFSPNNLIIRTILGNDPSSYGEPNVSLKPRFLF